MYTIYFTRLVNSSMLKDYKRMGMFVAVGPAAYTSTTFTSLGIQASKVLPATYLGLNGAYPVGYIWEAIGVPVGVFFWLFGFWNFLLATISVLFGVKKLHLDLTWWSLIFPQAGLTIAAIQLGNVLGSRASGRVLCSHDPPSDCLAVRGSDDGPRRAEEAGLVSWYGRGRRGRGRAP